MLNCCRPNEVGRCSASTTCDSRGGLTTPMKDENPRNGKVCSLYRTEVQLFVGKPNPPRVGQLGYIASAPEKNQLHPFINLTHHECRGPVHRQMSTKLLQGLQKLQVYATYVWLAILRGWVTLRLKFTLKGYVSRQYLWTLGKWLYYNFAAGNFHTKKLRSRLYSIETEFQILLKQNALFELPLERLGGNVRTLSIACWKARGRLPIRHNWTFFAITYGPDVISGNLSKLAFFKGSGSIWAKILHRKGLRPPTAVGVRKREWLPFRVASKYPQCIICFCHKARVWQTDKRTDGQNYDSQDRASIAASRSKNHLQSHSRSSLLALFDRSHMTFCYALV